LCQTTPLEPTNPGGIFKELAMFNASCKSEDRATYKVTPVPSIEEEDALIERAKEILERRIRSQKDGALIESPSAMKDLLAFRLASLDYEAFGVVYLNARHEVISLEELFRGTLSQTSVYPREVVKECLLKGAGSVVIYHNHPSGSLEPSSADQKLTQALRDALALVDVRVLDHIIVGGAQTTSFAERGLL
jgi:DNA repair protein RadC